jgi:hypothetical protein
MESLWVYAFTAFVVAAIADGGKPSLLGAMVVVFASFGISRFLQQRTNLDLGVLRIWGVLLSFIVFYAVVRIDFFGDWRLWDFSWADRLFNDTTETMDSRVDVVFGVPILWAFWIRGVLRGQQHLGFEEVVGSFALGVGLIAFVELFQGSDDTPAAVGLVAVPYMAIGLMAIALSHAGRSADEFTRAFAPTWLLTVGGSVLALAVIALLFVVIDYGAVADLLATGGKAIGWVLAHLIYYVTWPVVWLIERAMEGVRWAFENLWGGERRPFQEAEPPGQEEPSPEEEESRPLPGWARLLARIITGGTIVTLLIVATALFFRRFRRRDDALEVKESTYKEGRFGADVSGLLGSFFGRLRSPLRFGDNLDPARRLYFDMLGAAHQKGVERRPGETPLELRPRIDEAIGAGSPEKITSVFERVRYASMTATPDEVEALRREWESRSR